MAGSQIPAAISKAIGQLTVSTETRGAVLLVWASVTILLVLLQALIVYIRRIIDSARNGKPFDPVNARRIRAMGILVIGFGLARIAYFAAAYLYLSRFVTGAVVEPVLRVDTSIGFVTAGLLLLALAEICRRGTELQQDHDMTV